MPQAWILALQIVPGRCSRTQDEVTLSGRVRAMLADHWLVVGQVRKKAGNTAMVRRRAQPAVGDVVRDGLDRYFAAG